jgi:hypothetical protein
MISVAPDSTLMVHREYSILFRAADIDVRDSELALDGTLRAGTSSRMQAVKYVTPNGHSMESS